MPSTIFNPAVQDVDFLISYNLHRHIKIYKIVHLPVVDGPYSNSGSNVINRLIIFAEYVCIG